MQLVNCFLDLIGSVLHNILQNRYDKLVQYKAKFITAKSVKVDRSCQVRMGRGPAWRLARRDHWTWRCAPQRMPRLIDWLKVSNSTWITEPLELQSPAVYKLLHPWPTGDATDWPADPHRPLSGPHHTSGNTAHLRWAYWPVFYYK